MTAVTDRTAAPVATGERLRLRRLGIDTYLEAVVYMRSDCPVCHAEGFNAQSRVMVTLGDRHLIATLNVVAPPLLAVGEGPVLSVLVMQLLAFILSICSTVDSFFVLAFVNTFTTGSVVSFLSFGPMVDIKSTMMFTGVFRRRTVLYLVLLPFVMNLFAGVLINALGITF